MTAAFEQVLQIDLGGRVLNFDSQAASEAAAIFARVGATGRPIEFRDALIAGTVAAPPGSVLATRNTRHFADTGIPLVDPWSAGPP